MKKVVLTEHAGHVEYIYESRCGILTYNKHRKRHNWIVVSPDGTRTEYGEDYKAACDAGLATPGCQLVLHLDGKPLFTSQGKRTADTGR